MRRRPHDTTVSHRDFRFDTTNDRRSPTTKKPRATRERRNGCFVRQKNLHFVLHAAMSTFEAHMCASSPYTCWLSRIGDRRLPRSSVSGGQPFDHSYKDKELTQH